jgi:hypothetical protein
MRHAWISRVALVSACAALLAGCGGGGGDDSSSAESTARAYVEASNQRDFQRLCDVLGDAYKLHLHIDRDCPGFLGEQTSGGERPSLHLVGVHQNGDSAIASLTGTVPGQAGTGTGTIQVRLEKQDGDWKVVSIGGNLNFQQ